MIHDPMPRPAGGVTKGKGKKLDARQGLGLNVN
jgi:hypothetical protein